MAGEADNDEQFVLENARHAKLQQENLELKARLRNILQFISEQSQTPSITHAQKFLDPLTQMDLPTVHYQDLLEKQLKDNRSSVDLIRRKLLTYYQPTLNAVDQKAMEKELGEYDCDAEKFQHQKMLQTMGKGITVMTRKVAETQNQIRSAISENANLLAGKQYLEKDLVQQKEASAEYKVSTEKLKDQFLLVNSTVSKFLRHLNSMPDQKWGKAEKTVRSMRSTLCKLSKENSRLQSALEGTLKDEKLFEVKYKALSLEAQRTWKSGVNKEGRRGAPIDEDGSGGSPSGTEASYLSLEKAEEQASTGLPNPEHHEPVWNLTSRPVKLVSEPDTEENKMARSFLTKIIHNPGQEGVEIFNQLFLDAPAEERYRAIKYLAREFCLHHRKGATMTQLMKDLQEMNKFRDVEIALRSITTVICRTLECDHARCWYVNNKSNTAWVIVTTKKNESRMITKDLSDDSFVSKAFRTEQTVNIGDAYASPTFNRELDEHSGYRTKAVLCVPIRTQGKVRAVIESINKISTASSVFEDFDEFLLHVIGYATVDVVNKCQKHRANVQASQRKDILLEAAEDLFQKCYSVKDLLRVLQDRMTQMFKATEIRIVLVHPNHLQRVDVDLDGCLLTREFSTVGLVGECVQEGKFFSADKPRRTCGRRFHHGVDLDSDGKVYFWPMLYQDQVSVVLQFAVPEQGPMEAEEDGGGFNANDQVHVQAMEKLFAMVMFFIEKWWPSHYRLNPNQKKMVSKFHSYVEFKKLMQPHQWKAETEGYAVLIIQRWFRRNKLRAAIFGLARRRIQSAKFIGAYWKRWIRKRRGGK